MAIDRQLLTMLKEAGAVLARTNKHHIYKLPNGQTIVVSRTPSDHRATMNNIARLRRIARTQQ
jgi:predicted RNA binding protein YcfA (HicA-like mRNA interferase family)